MKNRRFWGRVAVRYLLLVAVWTGLRHWNEHQGWGRALWTGALIAAAALVTTMLVLRGMRRATGR